MANQVAMNENQAKVICDLLQGSVGHVLLTQQGDGSVIVADDETTIEVTKAGTEFPCED